ncbi:hypothetical protein [Nocardia sp. NPDC057455]|uniref:hypothetical protein n=1 Tax=Nocardia sp. NPDC057455 TaxID=3346138 RepID=UPI003672D09F
MAGDPTRLDRRRPDAGPIHAPAAAMAAGFMGAYTGRVLATPLPVLGGCLAGLAVGGLAGAAIGGILTGGVGAPLDATIGGIVGCTIGAVVASVAGLLLGAAVGGGAGGALRGSEAPAASRRRGGHATQPCGTRSEPAASSANSDRARSIAVVAALLGVLGVVIAALVIAGSSRQPRDERAFAYVVQISSGVAHFLHLTDLSR